MSENTVSTVTLPGDPTLDALHSVMTQAVADLERVKAKSDESVEDAVARIFRNTNEDEVPGVESVRAAILAIVENERAESGDLSDEQRAEIRKSARERYNKAKTTFDTLVSLGAATPQDGYSAPEAPGGSRGVAPGTKRGFESPRGLVHTATVGDKSIEGTFATLSGATKDETRLLVETLKSVVDDFDNIGDDEEISWAFDSAKFGRVNVTTRRKK